MLFRFCYLLFAAFICFFTLSVQASEHWTDIRDDLTDSLNDAVSTPEADSNNDTPIVETTTVYTPYEPRGNWQRFGDLNSIPSNAVVGGYNNGRSFIICRVGYYHKIIPGIITNQGCEVSDDRGILHAMPWGEVLIGNGYYWVAINNVQPTLLSHAAVVAGQDYDHHVPLFICQGKLKGDAYIGKYENGYCYISLNGREAIWNNYSILCRHN